MSYRRMDKQDLWQMYRRRCAGQNVSQISARERRDRKTVREYLQGLEELGLELGHRVEPLRHFPKFRCCLGTHARKYA